MENTFVESSWAKKDKTLERQLRPKGLSDFVGQEGVVERLSVLLGAARKRSEALTHILFHGPPGLGKTTLSHILSNEMRANLVITSGPMLEKPGDLAGILTSLQEGDILFIDEIHRMSKTIEEYLYSAMEDFKLDLLLDSGPQARSVRVDLQPFTLVGATTRIGLLSSPLRSRFGFTCRLDYYTPEILNAIILRSAKLLAFPVDPASSLEIANRSRGTPRISNNLLRWVRDFAQMRSDNKVDRITTRSALEMLSIDHLGLDETDKKLLSVIIDHHEGGPVGISTLAAALGEDTTTLEEVNEPYLIMQGFLRRTLRGREATDLAYRHLGKSKGTTS